ncbi:MAG: chemotaxis protein CheW [Desulfatibacillaceae bacterium]|nr:chemotaxis protein CheW [Desulfatibacillaceae bacterium]
MTNLLKPKNKAGTPSANSQESRQDKRLILEQRAKALAKTLDDSNKNHASISLLAFGLGQEQFAVPITCVKEIAPLEGLTRVPCTPGFILGVVNFRGRIVSLMDIAAFMGLETKVKPEHNFVVLVGGNDASGHELELCLAVSDLPVTRQVAPSRISPADTALSRSGAAFVRGVTDDMLVILDMEKMLADPAIIIHQSF